MAKSNVRYLLTGPRKGQDFNPRNQPGVSFVEGVFETAVENDQIPGLSRVLAGYGAYQEHEIPEALREDAPAAKPKGKSNAKKKATSKSASTGKAATKTAAAGAGAAGTEAGAEGQGAAGTDGAGADGAQGAGDDLV